MQGMERNGSASADAYLSLAREGASEFVEKKSRFLGAARTVETMHEALAEVAALRARHPGASHVAWACVAGPGGCERRACDDGEVSGTAGAPLLNLLDRRGIRGALLSVVRYYGGTKLGSGGLLRAYTRAGADALDDAGTARMEAGTLHEIVCDLSAAASVLHRLKARGTPAEATEYGARATFRFFVAGEGGGLVAELRDLTAGRAEIRALGSGFRAAAGA